MVDDAGIVVDPHLVEEKSAGREVYRELEVRAGVLEAEQATLVEKLSSGEEMDYQSINLRLEEIQSTIATSQQDWEEAFELLETLED